MIPQDLCNALCARRLNALQHRIVLLAAAKLEIVPSEMGVSRQAINKASKQLLSSGMLTRLGPRLYAFETDIQKWSDWIETRSEPRTEQIRIVEPPVEDPRWPQWLPLVRWELAAWIATDTYGRTGQDELDASLSTIEVAPATLVRGMAFLLRALQDKKIDAMEAELYEFSALSRAVIQIGTSDQCTMTEDQVEALVAPFRLNGPTQSRYRVRSRLWSPRRR